MLSHKAHGDTGADIPQNTDKNNGEITYAKKSIEDQAPTYNPKITGKF
jgi:hypothetical protein